MVTREYRNGIETIHIRKNTKRILRRAFTGSTHYCAYHILLQQQMRLLVQGVIIELTTSAPSPPERNTTEKKKKKSKAATKYCVWK